VKAYAGTAVIFSPTVASLEKNQAQTWDITTSNQPNGTRLYWTIQHHGTDDDNFDAVSGSFLLFQNRGAFTINLSALAPLNNESFDVLIRADGINGTVLTMIEGIVYIGSAPPVVDLFDIMTACCLHDVADPFAVESLYIIGKG
jgi:hypothetical protein